MRWVKGVVGVALVRRMVEGAAKVAEVDRPRNLHCRPSESTLPPGADAHCNRF